MGWAQWSPEEVGAWLDSLGGIYARTAPEFIEAGVCGSDLPSVDANALGNLGVAKLFVNKFLAKISEVTAGSSESSLSMTAAQSVTAVASNMPQMPASESQQPVASTSASSQGLPPGKKWSWFLSHK